MAQKINFPIELVNTLEGKHILFLDIGRNSFQRYPLNGGFSLEHKFYTSLSIFYLDLVDFLWSSY